MSVRFLVAIAIIIGLVILTIVAKSYLFPRYIFLWRSFIAVTIVFAIFILYLFSPAFVRFSAPIEPQITSGEFPFRFEYEIGGERFIIEDVLIAEFVRSVRGNMVTPARRVWNTSLSDGSGGGHLGNEHNFLLKQTSNITITFRPGLAEYFMDDLCRGESSVLNRNVESFAPRVTVRIAGNPPILTSVRPEDSHKLLAEHNITLISWEYTPSIVNSFN